MEEQVRVITEAHHYNFWANVKLFEGRELTMDKDLADELVARGLVKIVEQKVVEQAKPVEQKKPEPSKKVSKEKFSGSNKED